MPVGSYGVNDERAAPTVTTGFYTTRVRLFMAVVKQNMGYFFMLK